MSHHTLLELHSEIQSTKRHKIRSILRWNIVLLSILYISIGVIPYMYFGGQIITFKYGNILLCYQFSKLPMIVCNSLVIIFVLITNILKFKPAKEIFTCIFRETYRDSTMWNFFSITLIHIFQTIISCIIVQTRFELSLICFFISGLTVPLITIVFPFLFYYMSFYYETRVMKRRRVYLLFLFLGLFIQISVGSYIVILLIKGDDF